MGPATRRLRSLWRAIGWMLRTAITFAVTTSVYAESMNRSARSGVFDDLVLPALDLSANPGLRYLSAQGNRLHGLDVSKNRQLDRLLLFDNRFDRRGIEGLLSGLTAHGKSDGFLGLSDLRKQNLSLAGRVNLATLRSRNWSVPRPAPERRFGLRARAYLWDPGSLGRRETSPVWSYASSSDSASAQALPRVGFVDDEPRWFFAKAPEGFYSVTSIDLSNKGLVDEVDLESFPSLFQVKLTCNLLASVNVSANRWLTTIDFADNRLTGIDLAGNPRLEELRLSNNDLATLNLRENPAIQFLDARYNKLSSESIDSILDTLVAHGRKGGIVLLDGGGNSAPTARGRGAAWVLARRSWQVDVNRQFDYDADSLPDGWELEMFKGFQENGFGDADGDGLSNLRESLLYLDPTNPDSDGDGYADGAEVTAATNPLDPEDVPQPSGVVAGTVWNDSDRDFVREAGEAGIAEINVFLSHGTGAVRTTSRMLTSLEGSYRFSGLKAGTYSVAIDWGDWKPLGATVRKVVLKTGDARAEIDFALIDPSLTFSQWLLRNFGEEAADPSEDPDGDGYPNLLEYALGNHPLIADTRDLPQVEPAVKGEESFLLFLRYRVDRNAVDVRVITETFRNGEWQELDATSVRGASTREASIPVRVGEVGLLRLRAILASDSETVVQSPLWAGHAFALHPGVRISGLPLVHRRLLGGRVRTNDATSLALTRVDAPLAEILGNKRAYLEVVEGPFEGERWEVASIQPLGDRLSLAVNHAANTRLGPLPDLAGRKVVVRPHFTLGQVFGRAGEQVLIGAASSKEADRVWFLESGRLSPYHFAASEDGTRTLGWSRWTDLSRFWDDRPIFPGEGFFTERVGENGVALFLVGEVRSNRMAMPLRKGSNFVALGHPSRQSFSGLGLTPLSGLTSGSRPDRTDQAFLWNGGGFDSYFLFGDIGSGSRWSLIGDKELIDRANFPLIGHDEGFFLDLIEPRHLYFPPSAPRHR